MVARYKYYEGLKKNPKVTFLPSFMIQGKLDYELKVFDV